MPTTTPTSTDTAAVFDPPNRTAREVCWDARDKFFGCLDKNNIIHGESQDAKAKCANENTEFKNKCIESWYKYFQDKRLFDLRRQDKIKELEAEGAKKF